MLSVLVSLKLPAGAIVDSTCRLWRQLPCGERGACLLYDTDQFRWKLFVTVGCFKLVMGVLDSVVRQPHIYEQAFPHIIQYRVIWRFVVMSLNIFSVFSTGSMEGVEYFV